jgi:O-antigen/teichoic acid export membrane protein
LENKKNSVWLSIQFIISLIFSFITLKLNFLQFGEKIFGIWILMISFWGVSNIIDLGFGTAIIKYVAVADRNKDQDEINKIASTGYLFFLLVGFIILTLGIAVGHLIYFGNENLIPGSYKAIFWLVFLLLGCSFYLQYITLFFRSLLEGLNNFVITSKLTLFFNSLILLSVAIVYLNNLNIKTLALFFLISSFFSFSIYFFVLKRKYRHIKIKIRYSDFSFAKKMLGFSFNVQIAAIIGALIDPTIKYIIGTFSSTSFISYYEVARKFAVAISGLFNTAFKTLLPRTSILSNNKEYRNYILEEGIKFAKFGIIYSGFFYGISSILIVFIINLWFGFKESVIIFFLLSLAESINNVGFVIYTFFIGIGKGIYLIFIQTTNILLVSICLITGLQIFHTYLGLIGYFFAVLINNLLMIYLLKRQTEIKLSHYLVQINAQKLFYLFSSILFVIFFNYIFRINIYILVTMLSVLSFIIFKKELKKYFHQFKGLMTDFKSS